MKFDKLKKILLRLFNSYIKKHLNKLILSLFLSLLVAGSTGAIAWLLDPAIKKADIGRIYLFISIRRPNIKIHKTHKL